MLLGDTRTMIYKRDQGIVLNEPTVVAYTPAEKTIVGKKTKTIPIKILAVGKATAKLDKTDDDLNGTLIASPIQNGHILEQNLATKIFDELFKKVSDANLALKRRCLFCIPCSLSDQELNAYKHVAYSAKVADAEFIPMVITNAYGMGHNIDSTEAIISIVLEDGITDIAIIKNATIVAGGTLPCEDNKTCKGDKYYKKITDAVTQLMDEPDLQIISEIKKNGIYVGGRKSTSKELKEFLTANLNIPIILNDSSFNSVINGAGKLLNHEPKIKKIVKLN